MIWIGFGVSGGIGVVIFVDEPDDEEPDEEDGEK